MVRVVQRITLWIRGPEPVARVTSPALLRYLERQRFGNRVDLEPGLVRLERPADRAGDLTRIVIVPNVAEPLAPDIVEAILEAARLDPETFWKDLSEE